MVAQGLGCPRHLPGSTLADVSSDVCPDCTPAARVILHSAPPPMHSPRHPQSPVLWLLVLSRGTQAHSYRRLPTLVPSEGSLQNIPSGLLWWPATAPLLLYRSTGEQRHGASTFIGTPTPIVSSVNTAHVPHLHLTTLHCASRLPHFSADGAPAASIANHPFTQAVQPSSRHLHWASAPPPHLCPAPRLTALTSTIRQRRPPIGACSSQGPCQTCPWPGH
jgi:hypothetical protein